MDKYLKNYLNLHKMIGGQRKKITFNTGNQDKKTELIGILGDSMELKFEKIDLPELQGEPEEVACEKVKLAVTMIEGPVLIEDSSLCFNALGGLPGVYIKWFSDKIGNEGLYKMLEGFEDKTAYAQCIFTYCEGPGAEPILFKGITKGQIVKPRGDKGFGWDAVFLPDGYDKTFGELEKVEKNKISPRARALELVKAHFTKNP